jgi:hypothetical protein
MRIYKVLHWNSFICSNPIFIDCNILVTPREDAPKAFSVRIWRMWNLLYSAGGSRVLVDNSTLSLASPRFSSGSAVGSPSMGSVGEDRTI